MRVNMYGIGSCHDCVDAEKILLEKNVQLNYLDFSKSALHLKSFLKLRDTLPLMEEVREGGYIGIPLFQLEDGTLTLNLQDVLDRL